MFAMQYSHRLPADCDMTTIRQRAARHGPIRDDAEGLVFKAVVSRERGRHGGAGHLYASVYLWREPAAAARFGGHSGGATDRANNSMRSFHSACVPASRNQIQERRKTKTMPRPLQANAPLVGVPGGRHLLDTPALLIDLPAMRSEEHTSELQSP